MFDELFTNGKPENMYYAGDETNYDQMNVAVSREEFDFIQKLSEAAFSN